MQTAAEHNYPALPLVYLRLHLLQSCTIDMWRISRKISAELPASWLRALSFRAAGSIGSLTPDPPVLLREYIQEALYSPTAGYFASNDAPVGMLDRPLSFRNLLGRDGYHFALDAAYKKLQVSWLTPSEIFSPYYGGALAECILSHHLSSGSKSPLEVYELGAGTGTVARDILDYVKRHAPKVYGDMRYTTVEISSNLARLQHEKVAVRAGHGGVFCIERRDATSPEGWVANDLPCYVIALEVMDNLPHDRIVWQDGEWLETVVASSEGALQERCQKLQDPLIQRCMDVLDIQPPNQGKPSSWLPSWLQAISNGEPDPGIVFLPTKCLKLIETLHHRRPNHRLLAADFSELPDIQVPGVNAPLVSSTIQGRAVDYGSYLTGPGQADIFFPTDFQGLKRMYTAARGSIADDPSPSSVANVSDFMYSFADWKATTTISGFNPLLEDFTNTKILVGNMTARIREHAWTR